MRLAEILPAGHFFHFGPRAYQAFRINTLKITVEGAIERLQKEGIDFKQTGICPYAIIVEKSVGAQLLASTFVQDGLLYAQGLESMLPVLALDPQPGERILDLCAAPGSKTSQMAMHMKNQGLLRANEPIAQRRYRLKSVLQLTGANAEISSVDGRRFQDTAGFDRILVDAPCSTEGRFVADDPKSFAYWSLRKIKEMSHKQKGLLLNASRLLKRGGVMVYATCTFAPEENEEVVDWFLRKTEEKFEMVPVAFEGITSYPALKSWQKRSFDPQVALTTRVLPDERMEGFFIAKFKKCIYK